MQYLSDEWFVAANAAVRAADNPPNGLLVVDQIVGDTRWRIEIGPDPSLQRMDLDAPRDAQATFSQSREAAEAIATGATDAHQAFLLGDVIFDGEIDVLIEQRDALAWLEAALEPVMAATTW